METDTTDLYRLQTSTPKKCIVVSLPFTHFVIKHETKHNVHFSFTFGDDAKTFPQNIHDAMADHRRLCIFSKKQREAIQSSESHVFITGPPGSGKTLVLAQKAAHWLHDAEKVFIIYKHGETTTQPASEFVRYFVRQIQNKSDGDGDSQIQNKPDGGDGDCQTQNKPNGDDGDCQIQNNSDGGDGDSPGMYVLGLDCCKNVDEFIDSEVLGRVRDDSLTETPRSTGGDQPDPAGGQGVNFIIDEVSQRTQKEGKLLDLIAAIRTRLPKARVWSAGLLSSYCPTGLSVKRLDYSYRCPVRIQRLLNALEQFPRGEGEGGDDRSNEYRYVTSSTEVPEWTGGGVGRRLRLPGGGADPRYISHAGHSQDEIWKCAHCSESLVRYLRDLLCSDGDGAAGRLQESDFILHCIVGLH